MAVLTPARARRRHTTAWFVAAVVAGFVVGACMADSGAAYVRALIVVLLIAGVAASHLQRRRYR